MHASLLCRGCFRSFIEESVERHAEIDSRALFYFCSAFPFPQSINPTQHQAIAILFSPSVICVSARVCTLLVRMCACTHSFHLQTHNLSIFKKPDLVDIRPLPASSHPCPHPDLSIPTIPTRRDFVGKHPSAHERARESYESGAESHYTSARALLPSPLHAPSLRPPLPHALSLVRGRGRERRLLPTISRALLRH